MMSTNAEPSSVPKMDAVLAMRDVETSGGRSKRLVRQEGESRRVGVPRCASTSEAKESRAPSEPT